MKIIISNIKMSLDYASEDLRKAAAKKLGTREADFKSLRVIKESVDARKKSDISLVYSVQVETDDNFRVKKDKDIRIVQDNSFQSIIQGNEKLNGRPVIIGTGPAGLFAGLALARAGYKPVLFERGDCVEKRVEAVSRYWKSGVLDTETNVQFGEGGAGTFSDGKLTTRINDGRCDLVLNEFHNAGAPEEILFKARPHIGSDLLRKVVVNMRKKIEELGGTVMFNSKLTSLDVKDGRIIGIGINNNEKIDADVVILAIGHSARDTFEELLNCGVGFIQKPFSIGVRIEHKQEMINKAQYGAMYDHPKLGVADYQLFHKTPKRTAYTFCMCPGGIVVASASEKEMIVTNGMSNFSRDGENANSAFVVSVEPSDFNSSHPLAGVEFQRNWERLAYKVGGGSKAAPVQLLKDFVDGRASKGFGSVRPSYTGSVNFGDINSCLPVYITDTMKEALNYFDSKLHGFASGDAVLTGVETRTSSPVRIPRDELLEAVGIKGLYPAGEGAGYAGGIVSAGVDGLRVAERIIEKYKAN